MVCGNYPDGAGNLPLHPISSFRRHEVGKITLRISSFRIASYPANPTFPARQKSCAYCATIRVYPMETIAVNPFFPILPFFCHFFCIHVLISCFCFFRFPYSAPRPQKMQLPCPVSFIIPLATAPPIHSYWKQCNPPPPAAIHQNRHNPTTRR